MIARYLILCVIGGMLASGCHTKPVAKGPAPSTPTNSVAETTNVTEVATNAAVALSEELSVTDVEQRAEALARYATGLSYEINEQDDLALEEFYKTILIDPGNQALVLETARGLLRDKQTEKAIEILKKATSQPTASGTLFGLLARAHLHAGATNDAMAASQIAIKRSPNSITAYQSLTEIYLQIGRTNELVKVLDQAAKQTKVDSTFLISLAELYGKYAQANAKLTETLKPRVLDLLNRAAEDKPQSPTVLQKMADAYVQFGESEKAAAIYGDLLGRYSDLPLYRDLLREKLANIYLLGNDKSKATEQLEAIVRDNPTKYPQAYYVLGTLAFEQRQFDKAADFFNRAIVVSPQLEQAYYDLAASLLNLEKAPEALETIEKANKKFSPNFVGEFYAGLALQKLKNYGEALRRYTAAEVIAKAGDSKRLDYMFYFQLGACAERNRDYVQSEKYFEKALELKPNEPETLNYLGYMWADRGVNLDRAREMIEKAVKLEPENAAFLDSLGWVLFKLKLPEQALPYLLKSAELMKQPDPTVFDHLGDVYSAMKQPDKAREAWQKSLQLEQNDEVKKKLSLSL